MAISIPNRTWLVSQSIQDTNKRLKFLEAIIMYKMDGTMSEDDDIAPLMMATLWSEERNKKISDSMKWNSNAKKVKTVKTDKNRWKQITVLSVLEGENNSVLDNNSITNDINNLIQELKETSNNLWIVYDKKNERNFCRHILTGREFWEAADKAFMTRVEFAKNIMRASAIINYWKWVCAWPMSIYQNYSEVYNKSLQENAKQNKNKIYSF